jgi:hypothetical protein
MKHLFLLFMLCLVITFSACNQDKCKDAICTTINSVCDNGICVCKDGYEANAFGACVLPVWNEKLIGRRLVTDGCSSSGTSSYNVTLAPNSAIPTEVQVSNFWDVFNSPVILTMRSATTFDIILQEPDRDGLTVQSTTQGTFDPSTGRITVSYRVTDTNTANVDECNSTWN